MVSLDRFAIRVVLVAAVVSAAGAFLSLGAHHVQQLTHNTTKRFAQVSLTPPSRSFSSYSHSPHLASLLHQYTSWHDAFHRDRNDIYMCDVGGSRPSHLHWKSGLDKFSFLNGLGVSACVPLLVTPVLIFETYLDVLIAL